MAVSHSGTKVHIVSQEKIMTYLIEGGNGNEIDTFDFFLYYLLN